MANVSTPSDDSSGKAKRPRTARGERTRRALLDAAVAEFGDRGFHASSISAITQRAGVALGSFYTWFENKDAIFRAVVGDLSEQVRDHVTPAIAAATDAVAAEREGLAAFLRFVSAHREIYRIIDESEFVDPESFERHYARTARRIEQRLAAGAAAGTLREGLGEVEAWAIMGMNVFLGLRFGVNGTGDDLEAVAATANSMLSNGIGRR